MKNKKRGKKGIKEIKKESITRKTVRRSKRIKIALKNFEIYYQNGYGLVYRNDRSANSGEILVLVRDNIKNFSLKSKVENNVGQSFWILVTNTNKKIRVWVIYTPQQNLTPNNQLKIKYEDSREQIKIGKEEKQQKIIQGDFNTRIGAAIQGNKAQVTKGRRQLLKLANRENIIILKTVKEKWKGVWRRVQGEDKSITDYVLTDTANADTVKKIKIDEEKQYGLYKLEKNTAINENLLRSEFRIN